MRLIEALAQTFGVAPTAPSPTAQLSIVLRLTPEALQALTDLIQHTRGK